MVFWVVCCLCGLVWGGGCVGVGLGGGVPFAGFWCAVFLSASGVWGVVSRPVAARMGVGWERISCPGASFEWFVACTLGLLSALFRNRSGAGVFQELMAVLGCVPRTAWGRCVGVVCVLGWCWSVRWLAVVQLLGSSGLVRGLLSGGLWRVSCPSV